MIKYILLISLFALPCLAQSNSHLSGYQVIDTITKKLKIYYPYPRTKLCSPENYYFGSNNTLEGKYISLGGVTSENGRALYQNYEAPKLQAIFSTIDDCIDITNSKIRLEITSEIFSRQMREALCRDEFYSVCPPGININDTATMNAVFVQILFEPGGYRDLSKVDPQNEALVFRTLANRFFSYLLGPDELLLESMTPLALVRLKAEFANALKAKISSVKNAERSSETLMGFAMKSLLIRNELLKIRY